MVKRHPVTWRLRRNPLRRRVDIVEGWFIVAACVFAVVGALAAGLAVAHSAAQSLERHRNSHYAVSAVLTRDAPGTRSAWALGGGQVRAPVRWSAPDGTTHTGITHVPSGARAGTRTTVWVDARGALTSKPLTGVEAAIWETLDGTLAAAGVVAVVAVGTWRLRVGLNRYRMEQWSTEWDHVGTRRGWNAGS
ncbi:hypothetical protein WDA79_10990 [Streptomyces sp. A475]|uniref:Rv1733c family protein n=1 Tax=Streptomyces sp. A475 TaxID=3131976 RepID=UPI0030C91B84